MFARLLNLWEAWRAHPSVGWRWLGYALTAAGLAYVAYILFFQWRDLAAVDWRVYLKPALLALGLYLPSLLLQFAVWRGILASYRPADWRDVEIYARMMMARRLPGGFWHWLSRAALYTAATQLPTRVVIAANFVEWSLLILVGLAIFAFTQPSVTIWGRLIFGAAALIVGLGVAVAWQSRTRALLRRLAEAALWSSLYAASWLLGGLILWLFTRAGGSSLSLLQAVNLWSLGAAIGMLLTVVPAAFGVNELTLTVLLQPYLSQSLALVIAILLRFVFTAADLVWGLLGWGLSAAILKRRAQAEKLAAASPPAETPA